MNWLVTGGCGFLGTALIRNLMAEGGHSVRVVDNLRVGTREDLGTVCDFVEGEADGPIAYGVELVVGDILDEGLALRAANGADVVVHLAANTGVGPSVEDPRGDCVTNVLGTLNYLEAARHAGVSRFVFASSGAPVGEVEPPIHEELAPHPVSPYGASKLAGEGYCSAYFRTYGVPTVALRFGNVYGPGSGHKGSVVAKFVKRAMAGEVLEVYGDGTQTRDFIYVEDLIRAVRLAATVEEAPGETFQIATNAETTVGELVEKLLPALATEGVKGVEVRNTAPPFKEVMRNYSDTSKARRVLGWQAEVGLDEGLQRTAAFFIGASSGDAA
ncbi:MAG: NAD-dependent epimerase/dehydratase family protein [Actinomycetota bacterium]|nr:NAD-dependent epimerase/dehydratase family protein [Actinomycetota bacterium]